MYFSMLARYCLEFDDVYLQQESTDIQYTKPNVLEDSSDDNVCHVFIKYSKLFRTEG